MQVETVTTSDGTLLKAVRATLGQAEEAFMCVAFVHERGLQLLRRELEDLRARKARTRLLVTTTFGATADSALALASRLGAEVRVLNPGAGRTFHPKLYLGQGPERSRAVIGSANLTGGLYANIEAAVALEGARDQPAMARAWDWAGALWEDPRGAPWAGVAATPGEETFEPELYRELEKAVRADPVFLTLGRARENRVVELTPVEVRVQTDRSLARTGGGEPVPAWMFNLAWERLRTHGRLSNSELLNVLRVHRSTAVCAILARLPQVEREAGRGVVLKLKAGQGVGRGRRGVGGAAA